MDTIDKEVDTITKEVTTIASKYKHRVDRSKVASKAYWNKKRADAAQDAAPTQVGEGQVV